MTEFDQAIASEPVGDGHFALDVQDGWGTPVGPNGGYVGAALLTAMETLESTQGRLPRTLALHFVRALRPGPAELCLVEEQVGRGMTRLSARVVQNDRRCVCALAAYAAPYPVDGFGAISLPDVPAADELSPVPPADPVFTIFPRMDMRQTFGPAPGSGGDRAEAGGWTTLRERQPLSFQTLALYADCWWPTPWGVFDETLPAPTIDLTLHFCQAPPPNAGPYALCRFTSETAIDGFFTETGQVWASDGTLLVQSVQLALLTQPATTRVPDPRPAAENGQRRTLDVPF